MRRAALHVVVRPGPFKGRAVCVFVSYSRLGRVKRYVRLHLDRLRRMGIDVFFVMIADRPTFLNLRKRVGPNVGLIVRQNLGFDFGAWADVSRTFPEIWEAETLFLINDSIFGPFGRYEDVFQRVKASKAALIALTESFQVRRHYQSYFLSFNGRLARKYRIQDFWNQIENLPTKQEVIQRYEVGLLEHCLSLGMTSEALFPAAVSRFAPVGNPTHNGWQDLVRQGYPYMKVELLKENPSGAIFLYDWRRLVSDPHVLRVIDHHFRSDV
jgi:lipopolysaccharide biosynthesis protein